jgi:hypothetical protein
MFEIESFPMYWLPESEEDHPVLELFSNSDGADYMYARPNSRSGSSYAMARVEVAGGVLTLSDLEGVGWGDDKVLGSVLDGIAVRRRTDDVFKGVLSIKVHTDDWTIRKRLFEKGFLRSPVSPQDVMQIDTESLRPKQEPLNVGS